jgi:transcriptional regulator with XRE-family HTH domain
LTSFRGRGILNTDMPVTKPIYISPIKKQRRKLGLSQEALAAILAEMGVRISRQEISHYEMGYVNVPAKILPVLDKALDLMEGTLYYELNIKRNGGDE